jgi:hypothetical protein
MNKNKIISIEELNQAIKERDLEWFQVIESILGFHPVSITEALKIGIDRMKNKNARIKRLEDALSTLIAMHQEYSDIQAHESNGYADAYYCFYKGKYEEWYNAISALEDKESKL